jgi:methionyl-tRNA formyltransferase
MNIVFLGSKPIGFECFEYLLSRRNELGITVSGLLTQQRTEFAGQSDLAALAVAAGVPVLGHLDELPECDFIYSVQYHELLKPHHIAMARKLAVNLHMAPLPEYRGANQFTFAILEEKKEFGTTIHEMNAQIDHGAILFQKRFPIPEGCWVGDLYQKTYDASVKLFKQTLAHIVNGNYTAIPQAALVPKYGTSLHFKKEMAEVKVIDLNWKAEKMERHIRACAMPGFEPPYCLIGGRKVYFEIGPK